jgi:hypothetical protein
MAHAFSRSGSGARRCDAHDCGIMTRGVCKIELDGGHLGYGRRDFCGVPHVHAARVEFRGFNVVDHNELGHINSPASCNHDHDASTLPHYYAS